MSSPRVRIRGGLLVDPSQGLDQVADLWLEHGRVASIGEPPAGATPDQEEVVDAEGLVVTPGLIDGRVHLGEPGYEHRETLESGLRAAAAGGFTAVVSLPDTDPVNETRAVTEMLLRRGAALGGARLFPMAALTKGLAGEELAEIGELARAGAVAACDADRSLPSALLRRALLYAQHTGMPVVHRARDRDLDGDGVMHEGEWSTRLGLPGCPGISEEIMVARDLLLVADTGGRYHLSPVTTAGSLERIRGAKASGLQVTCDTTPHHLLLTDQAVADSGFDPATRLDPPLRPQADADALVAALADGTIDLLVSGHRPWHADEKSDVQFSVAPPGAVGLETTVAVCLDRLVGTGRLELSRFVELMSCAPAKLYGLPGGSLEPGRPADVTLLDLGREWTLDPEVFRSRGRSTPFAGWSGKGAPVATWVGGRRVDPAAERSAPRR